MRTTTVATLAAFQDDLDASGGDVTVCTTLVIWARHRELANLCSRCIAEGRALPCRSTHRWATIVPATLRAGYVFLPTTRYQSAVGVLHRQRRNLRRGVQPQDFGGSQNRLTQGNCNVFSRDDDRTGSWDRAEQCTTGTKWCSPDRYVAPFCTPRTTGAERVRALAWQSADNAPYQDYWGWTVAEGRRPWDVRPALPIFP